MGTMLFAKDERNVYGVCPSGMSIKDLIPLITDEPLLDFVVPVGKQMKVTATIVCELIDEVV